MISRLKINYLLNLSENKLKLTNLEKYTTVKNLINRPHYRILNRIIGGVSILVLIALFLPWTQNIRSKGNITSLFQEQRPQKVYSPIAGKISRWWVKEGDFVKKGDTLAKITEIKEDYLDPNLVPRTQEQLNAKKSYLEFYEKKVEANQAQIANLKTSKTIKETQ